VASEGEQGNMRDVDWHWVCSLLECKTGKGVSPMRKSFANVMKVIRQ